MMRSKHLVVFILFELMNLMIEKIMDEGFKTEDMTFRLNR